MEPHAVQHRLSFVCNWKHMHPPKPRMKQSRRNWRAPASPSPPLGLGCHILREAKWQVTLRTLGAFIDRDDLDLHVKLSTMGRLYRVSCSQSWVSAKEPGLGTKSDVQREHKRFCTYCVIAMAGHKSSRVQGRAILAGVFSLSIKGKVCYFLTISHVNLTCRSLMEKRQ